MKQTDQDHPNYTPIIILKKHDRTGWKSQVNITVTTKKEHSVCLYKHMLLLY